MLDEFFQQKIKENIASLRKVVALGVANGVPMPALANAIEYVDAFRAGQLGANVIQGQRDYFGAHTYKRIDREGSFHHEWQEHYAK